MTVDTFMSGHRFRGELRFLDCKKLFTSVELYKLPRVGCPKRPESLNHLEVSPKVAQRLVKKWGLDRQIREVRTVWRQGAREVGMVMESWENLDDRDDYLVMNDVAKFTVDGVSYTLSYRDLTRDGSIGMHVRKTDT